MPKEPTPTARSQIPAASDPPPIGLNPLVRFALSEGAGNARAIAAAHITVEERLADLCATCPSRGFSFSCPPHAGGAGEFRKLREHLSWAVVVQLVVPMSALFSGERRELGKFLHELVAGVEARAAGLGYTDSRALAGGSCKSIFCHDHPDCRRLAGGPCRHPEHARPSMSGFGINVPLLMDRCNWPSDLNKNRPSTGEESMSWLAGLVLIG